LVTPKIADICVVFAKMAIYKLHFGTRIVTRGHFITINIYFWVNWGTRARAQGAAPFPHFFFGAARARD